MFSIARSKETILYLHNYEWESLLIEHSPSGLFKIDRIENKLIEKRLSSFLFAHVLNILSFDQMFWLQAVFRRKMGNREKICGN